MYQYQYFDISLASNIFLPSLSITSNNTSDYIFQLISSSFDQVFVGEWIHHWKFDNGEIWLSLGKQGNEYLLQFPQLADFYFSPQNKTINCYAQPEISRETIAHLLLNQVMPLVLTYRGKYFLHASAVVLNGFGVAFLGKSGFGKSTLATSLGQKGLEVITDDCLLVEQNLDNFSVMPGPPQLRLWDKSIDFLFAQKQPKLHRGVNYTNKAHLYNTREIGIAFSRKAILLGCIYILSPPEPEENLDTIDIKPLSSREAMFHLLESVFRFDISDKVRVAQEFNFLGKIVQTVPCFRLTYPRNFELLTAVQSAIIEKVLMEIKL